MRPFETRGLEARLAEETRVAEEQGRVVAADGTELVLYRRGDEFQIRVDGLELMSSRAHGSEEALARLACAEIGPRPRPRVLIGGLGFGFTLRAALDALPGEARVMVAELFPAVVEWNRGPAAGLAAHPLSDPRVSVTIGDVRDVLAATEEPFDAVLLDVDNGPGALTLESNRGLYVEEGLEVVGRALTANGIVAVWSADPDAGLLRRLRTAGWEARTETVAALSDGTGPEHTIFLARPPAA